MKRGVCKLANWSSEYGECQWGEEGRRRRRRRRFSHRITGGGGRFSEKFNRNVDNSTKGCSSVHRSQIGKQKEHKEKSPLLLWSSFSLSFAFFFLAILSAATSSMADPFPAADPQESAEIRKLWHSIGRPSPETQPNFVHFNCSYERRHFPSQLPGSRGQ